MKEKFIHGLNDNDMMVEIIKGKLTKSVENKDVTSNQLLLWARKSGQKSIKKRIIKPQ